MSDIIERPKPDPASIEHGNVFQRNRITVLLVFNLAILIAIDLLAGWRLIPREHLAIEIFHERYNHGFRPNSATVYRYGDTKQYPMLTNSLGLRDSSKRKVPLVPDRRRILFMGDSFTEGVGVNYEESFVGRVATALAPHSIEVLNGGVKSYCPKLYYLKTEYLLEEGLVLDDLIVMIDASDIPDELTYESFEPRDPSPAGGRWHQIRRTLRKRSFTVYTIERWKRARRPAVAPPPPSAPAFVQTQDFNLATLGLWTVRQDLFESYGRKGLNLAQGHILKLIEICKAHGIRMTIGVYPNSYLVRERDLDSIQVRFWRAFAEKNGLAFVNLFPLFINEEGFDSVYQKFFIPGDIHWNEEGHRLAAGVLTDHILRHPLPARAIPAGGDARPRHP